MLDTDYYVEPGTGRVMKAKRFNNIVLFDEPLKAEDGSEVFVNPETFVLEKGDLGCYNTQQVRLMVHGQAYKKTGNFTSNGNPVVLDPRTGALEEVTRADNPFFRMNVRDFR